MAASTIVAPIAGTATAIYNEDRQMAIADRPFMMIQQTTPMVASLSIPRDAAMKPAHRSKNGMKVLLKVAEQELPGELTYVDITQPETVPSVLVKATFNNDKGLIKAGEFYTLVIESNVKAKCWPYRSHKAVRENSDGKYVYVLTENNTVDVRVVEVGITEGDDVAIISGLNAGDKVIPTDGTFVLGESVKL